MIQSSAEVETLARTVNDNGGVYFVPAFSGLFAPYWKANARGVIAGLTRYANKGHLARAVLEATAFQTREIVEAMEQDAGKAVDSVRVDGGMVTNELLMQFQADILDREVVLPQVKETTALGAAFAAGLAVGFFKDLDELRATWSVERRWTPQMDVARREELYRKWKRAVTRSMDWMENRYPRSTWTVWQIRWACRRTSASLVLKTCATSPSGFAQFRNVRASFSRISRKWHIMDADRDENLM